MSSAPASASAMVGPSLGLLRLRAPKEQSRFGIENGASSHTRQKPLPATGLTGEDGARRGVNVSLRNWAWQNGERCYARREGRTRGSGRAGTLAGRRAGRPAAPVLPSSSDHRGRKEGAAMSAVDFTCLLLFDRPEKQNLETPPSVSSSISAAKKRGIFGKTSTHAAPHAHRLT